MINAVHGLDELKLGTRGSQLALWQANAVAACIATTGGPPCRVVVIKTTGDRVQEAPLSEVGGKRLFVKEIEEALLRREIDLAVHSSKDMPAVSPPGLKIGAVMSREDPRDVIVLPRASEPCTAQCIEQIVAHLGQSPAIGTGSVRRKSQLARLIPGARFAAIRGNLDTRLRKLDEGQYDALVLAAAGLRRLGFGERISFALPASACLPAPGQGIVAVQIRCGDKGGDKRIDKRSDEGDDERDDEIGRIIARIDDGAAALALIAERALVTALGGGCQTPVAALASSVDRDSLDLDAAVFALDGGRAVRAHARGPAGEAAALGARVGAQLLADGADELLEAARRAHGLVEGIQP